VRSAGAQSGALLRDTTPYLRRTAIGLLLHEAGAERTTSEHLAAASGRLLERLSEHLAEVIGRAGIEALWLRAVKIRKSEFPFLDERLLSRDRRRPGEPFRACLHEQAPDVIREAWGALFATVAGLLATLIGDRLARALLQGAWPGMLFPDADPQETDA
jgi:hypothetical protein